MPKLIGISGPKGSGKDLFASYLIESMLGVAESYSFSYPLKKACCDMFGWDLNRVNHDRDFKESIDPDQGFSPRKAMQLLGTEQGRQGLRDDLQVCMAEKKYESSQADYFLLTDVRYSNERAQIDRAGGMIIHMHRPGIEFDGSHDSEIGPGCRENDFHIFNDGTKDDLRLKAEALASRL